MFKFIRKLPEKLRRIITSDHHKPLGRWRLEHENKDKLDTKIDWSNEDHCGPCGTSSIEEHIREVAIKKNEIRIRELKQELKQELKKKRQESMPIKK